MAQYQIKFNRTNGWSYSNEEEIPIESANVELSDEEVQTLVELMQKHHSYDVEVLNLEELYSDIYNKLNEACHSIAFDVAVAEALRDAHFDGSDVFGDRLYEFCEWQLGYEESLGDFDQWLYKYASNLNSDKLRDLYENANIDIWDEVLNFDGIEIGDYEVIIPQSIVMRVFNL